MTGFIIPMHILIFKHVTDACHHKMTPSDFWAKPTSLRNYFDDILFYGNFTFRLDFDLTFIKCNPLKMVWHDSMDTMNSMAKFDIQRL